MEYLKQIIAEPCEQVKKVGGKGLTFKNVHAAARFFDTSTAYIYYLLSGERKKSLPYKGFLLKWGDC